ncbi:WD repeat-containing 86-like, partial [Brachionus plicatilis]
DFDTGECIRKFTGHKNNITSILFIPSDRENDTQTLQFIQEQAEKSKKGIGKSLQNRSSTSAYDEDEIYSKDLIITGSFDSLAKSWSIETGECVQTFRGHTSAITCLATDLLGKLLFTGSGDHTIRSWDIMTGQLVRIFTGHQTTVLSLLAHRKLLYSTSSDHTARCWIMDFGDLFDTSDLLIDKKSSNKKESSVTSEIENESIDQLEDNQNYEVIQVKEKEF